MKTKALPSLNALFVLGWSAGHHDAAIALVKHDRDTGETTAVAADHAERWSGRKNEANLNGVMLDWILSRVTNGRVVLVAHQQWWRLRSGGVFRALGEMKAWHRNHRIILDACHRNGIEVVRDTSTTHHDSHAWAAWGTSHAKRAHTLVVDAIGENDCASRYFGDEHGLQRNPFQTKSYPDSMGLFYTAWTKYLGFKPNEEEYHLMALATCKANTFTVNEKLAVDGITRLLANLRGRTNWHRGVSEKIMALVEGQLTGLGNNRTQYVVAAAVQKEYEAQLEEYVGATSPKVLLSGGCALNCVANSTVFPLGTVEAFSNPGDAGSALGAALAFLGRKLSHPYSPMLGYGEDSSIYKEEHCVREAVVALRNKGLVAVVYGRSEYGPRALGHRSLLARPNFNKSVLDKIKNRVSYRPYGCVVDADDVPAVFDTPRSLHTPYMNTVLHFKEPRTSSLYRSVRHGDDTSRVQTVSATPPEGTWGGSTFLSRVMAEWKKQTGIPLLLNTSLNEKGKPLARTKAQIESWCKQHYVPLVSDQ